VKIVAIAVAAALASLAVVLTAHAGPPKGTTTLINPPALEDHPIDVDIALDTTAPIVPYEYSIVNQCWFDGSFSGHFDSYERHDLAGPWFTIDGLPHTTATINLQLVPAGAVCKVYVVKNNTTVKGTVTAYEVEAAP
jgi:hypothetical protein